MKFWVVLFILLSTGFASAQTQDVCINNIESIAPVFLETLATKYRPLMCSDNVLALKNSLQANGVQLQNAHVVVLRHKAVPYIGINPLRARLTFQGTTYKAPTWMFHVFLVVEGMVFDMDYTDQAQALGVLQYMDTMWDKDKLKDYVAQVTPLESYSSKDVYGTFSKEGVLSVAELMTFFTKTTCLEQPEVRLLHDSI